MRHVNAQYINSDSFFKLGSEKFIILSKHYQLPCLGRLAGLSSEISRSSFKLLSRLDSNISGLSKERRRLLISSFLIKRIVLVLSARTFLRNVSNVSSSNFVLNVRYPFLVYFNTTRLVSYRTEGSNRRVFVCYTPRSKIFSSMGILRRFDDCSVSGLVAW